MFVSAVEPTSKTVASGPAHHSAVKDLIDGANRLGADLAAIDAREAGLNLIVSAVIVAAALALIWSLRRIFDYWLRRFATASPADAKKHETPEAVGLTWLLVRLAIAAGALLLIGGVWGIDIFALVDRGFAAGLLRAVGIVILAVAAVEVAGFVVDTVVDGVAKRGSTARRAAQVRTLGPLIRGLIQTVLVVVAVLTFLSEIGVTVAPLLASAGVVGVAVGFGAQTLVKDFLTGLFLVAEDVVSVGDNVRIGDAGGVVEAMTLRTIRLRDQDGTLHIFPYSEAQVIHNRSASFSSYVAEVMVTYGTDLDLALSVMGQVGEGLRKTPEFTRKITKAFEVLGVEKLDPTGVILKARAITRPKDQWEVGREYNRRLKKAFEEQGIEIAYRPAGPPAATVPTADGGESSEAAQQSPPARPAS